MEDRIEADLAVAMSLATLAAEAGMSVFHFAREFRRTIGLTPYEYVLQRRLARAMDLLGRQELSVVRIAAETGFAHSSHLSRHMRRLTGLSPASFRREVLP